MEEHVLVVSIVYAQVPPANHRYKCTTTIMYSLAIMLLNSHAGRDDGLIAYPRRSTSRKWYCLSIKSVHV